MEHEHTPEAIGARLATEPRHTYLRDWVYGGIDGAVTNFAVGLPQAFGLAIALTAGVFFTIGAARS